MPERICEHRRWTAMQTCILIQLVKMSQSPPRIQSVSQPTIGEVFFNWKKVEKIKLKEEGQFLKNGRQDGIDQ